MIPRIPTPAAAGAVAAALLLLVALLLPASSSSSSAAAAAASASPGACAFAPPAPAGVAAARRRRTHGAAAAPGGDGDGEGGTRALLDELVDIERQRAELLGLTGGSASGGASSDDGGTDDDVGMARIAAQLERMRRPSSSAENGEGEDEGGGKGAEWRALYDELRMRPANALKEELKGLRLNARGRKPDLARRLADYHAGRAEGDDDGDDEEEDAAVETVPAQQMKDAAGDDAAAAAAWTDRPPVTSFAGLRTLSPAASAALTRASFSSATPVQAAAVPRIASGESALLHAETGSGKTIAYLLPLSELLWKERDAGVGADGTADGRGGGYALVLTPTRELAAQVAGVATVLAPPGSVRLVGKPTDLMGDDGRDRGESAGGGRRAREGRDDDEVPRLIVGSAKAVYTSLFGNEKMPAPPTSKPMAKKLLRSVRWMVLDEVDRLLNVKKSRSEKRFKRHEKPAAVLASTVARQTLGRAQVVAASATVGRPLRRELARVLGLDPRDCPEVVRGAADDAGAGSADGPKKFGEGGAIGRAVTIPSEVNHYVVPCAGSTSGNLLTSAAFAQKALRPTIDDDGGRGRRTLLVLSRECGLSVRNALGALRHFGCRPEPQSLLDALEADGGGTDRMIEVHRAVSGAAGIGESSSGGEAPGRTTGVDSNDEDDGGYLLVTGEDTVRGLHLDGLDAVIVVGRPHGPDEYTHIAGRTGRAGRGGDVISVVSYEQAAALTGWERMLDVEFVPLDVEELSEL